MQRRVQEFVRGGGKNLKVFFCYSMSRGEGGGGSPRTPPGHAPDIYIYIYIYIGLTYIYICIYVYMCVCVCVRGGGVYSLIAKTLT